MSCIFDRNSLWTFLGLREYLSIPKFLFYLSYFLQVFFDEPWLFSCWNTWKFISRSYLRSLSAWTFRSQLTFIRYLRIFITKCCWYIISSFLNWLVFTVRLKSRDNGVIYEARETGYLDSSPYYWFNRDGSDLYRICFCRFMW